jgi:hypothetical protein
MTKAISIFEPSPSDNQIIALAAFGVTSLVIGLWGLWALFFRTAEYAQVWPGVSAAFNAVMLIIMVNAKSATWKQVVGAYKPMTWMVLWFVDMAVVAIAANVSGTYPSEPAGALMFVSGMLFVWLNFGYAQLWKEQALKGVVDSSGTIVNVEKLGFGGF